MTTTPQNDTQSGSKTNGNGATTPTGNEPIVDPSVLAAAEQAETRPPAVDTSATIRDLHPPVHDETDIPGHKKGLGTAAKIAIIVALLGAVIFAAFHLGTRNAGTTVVTKTVPASTEGLVPKYTDNSACAWKIAPEGEVAKEGWCKDRSPGAYLFSDNSYLFCSCSKAATLPK